MLFVVFRIMATNKWDCSCPTLPMHYHTQRVVPQTLAIHHHEASRCIATLLHCILFSSTSPAPCCSFFSWPSSCPWHVLPMSLPDHPASTVHSRWLPMVPSNACLGSMRPLPRWPGSSSMMTRMSLTQMMRSCGACQGATCRRDRHSEVSRFPRYVAKALLSGLTGSISSLNFVGLPFKNDDIATRHVCVCFQ